VPSTSSSSADESSGPLGALRWAGRIAATIALLIVGPAAIVAVSNAVALAAVLLAVALGSWLLWPGLARGHATGIVVGATILAGLAGIVGFVVAHELVTRNDLCGEDGGSFGDAWSIPSALAYLAAGAASFTSPRRVLWGWPLSVLFGFAVLVGWAALFLRGGSCAT
jgi:hypothetical protein